MKSLGSESGPPFGNDSALFTLLNACDAADVDAAVEDLVCQAQAIIDPILGYYRRRGMLGAEECDDILSIVRLRVIGKLRQVAAGDSEAIGSFNGYVARLTYNAVKDVFRARNPQRTLFKKRLHDAIARDPRFVLDSTSGAAICRLPDVGGDAVALSSRTARRCRRIASTRWRCCYGQPAARCC